MKRLLTLALIGAALAAPGYAADVQNDIEADQGAIAKDNAALAKDNATLERDRAKKAAAKANGNYGKQAVDSMAIGADQTAIAEKKTEKDVDQKILQHHENEAANSTGQ